MLIYNVTCKVEWDIAAEWFEWMKGEHIPQVLDTGCFTRYQMTRVLHTDETEGPTYAIQYYAESFGLYDQYIAQHAPALRQQTMDKWGNKFIAFRSLMEIV